MMKFLKYISVGLCVLIIAVMACLAGVLFYLDTDHARQLITGRINAVIPGNLSWDRSDLSVFKETLEIHGFAVNSSSGKEIVGIDRISVTLDLAGMLKRRIIISDITIENPRVDLKVEQDGRLDLISALSGPAPEKPEPAKPEKPFPFPIFLKSFNLANGSFRYESGSHYILFKMEKLAVQGSADVSRQQGDIHVNITHGLFESPGYKTGISRVELTAALHGNNILNIVLDAACDSSALRATATVSDPFHNPEIDTDVVVSTSLSGLGKEIKALGGFSGKASARLTIKGTLNNPDAQLHLAYGGGNLYHRTIDSMEMGIGLNNRLLSVNRIHIRAFSGTLDLKGKVDLKGAFPDGFAKSGKNMNAVSYDFFIRGTGLDLGDVFENAGRTNGVINAGIHVYGKGTSLDTLSGGADINISGTGLKSGRQTNPVDLNAVGKFDLENNTVRISRFDVKCGNADIQATGFINLLTKSSFQLDFKGIDPEFFIAKNFLKGQFNGTLKIEGNYPDTVASLEITGTKTGLENLFFGDIKASATFSDGVVTVEKARLLNHKSSLSLSGRADILKKSSFKILENPSFNLDIQGDAVFIEDFYHSAKGEFSIDIHAGGNFKTPNGTIRLNGENIVFSDQQIHRVDLTAIIDGKKLGIEKLHVFPDPDALLECTGWISLDKQFRFEATSSGIPLEFLPGIKDANVATGSIVVDARGHGSFEDPEISGEIKLENLCINGKPLEDAALHLNVKNRMARISGHLNFDLNGSYRFSDSTFNIQARFRNTDLEPYFKLLERPYLNGFVTGRVEMAGTVGNTHTYTGMLDISDLYVGYNHQSVLKGNTLKILFKEQQAVVSGLHLTLAETGDLDISGKVVIDGQVSLTATGNIPLSVIAFFTEELPDLTGNILFTSRITGNFSAPEIEGDIRLSNVSATLPVTAQKLNHITGNIHITPKAVTIDEISGQLDAGRFTVSGNMALDRLKPTELALNLDGISLPVKIPGTLDISLNTNLKISGTPDKSRIDGDIVIVEGLYYKDVDLNFIESAVRKKRESLPASPREFTTPFLRQVDLNVAITYRNPFNIDNNLANMEIVPDLKLTGTVENPVINGRALIQSGTVEFRKKTFVIRKGVIDFLNPYRIEPAINIKSDVEVRDWLITLDISGTPDELSFKLTSDPMLEDADILSLLIIGRTSREMINSEGGSTQSAAQMLGRFLSATVDNRIKESTGLDIFEAEVQNGSGNDAASEVKVTMGKSLSKRLAVKYAVETDKGEMIQRAVAEYKFLESILVNGFQDNQGNFGGSVKYRLEFR